MPDAIPQAANAERFEQVVMPHLDAAYNLARWLVRNSHDAEDIVQEAYLRAFRFFGGFQGGDARPWLLKIVRNASYSFLEKNVPRRWISSSTSGYTRRSLALRTRRRRWCRASRTACCARRSKNCP